MFTPILLLAAVTVDAHLPAGNIAFEKIEGDQVFVHQELRDTQGDWFYWAMRVRGAEGRTLTFNFTKSVAVGVRGPVVSTDGGKTYAYAAEKEATRKSFIYTFGKDEAETWFYECLPYTPEMWTAFLSGHEDARGTVFTTDALCTSKDGASVPRAVFGKEAAKYRMVLTSRHHCSESVATYVVEGFAASYFGSDDLGAWLRENLRLVIVPFVDYDGAVAGDQGKNRRPLDHNRDYTAFTHPETKALAEVVTSLQPDVWFDIHCPWLYGDCNEYLYTPLKDPKLPYAHPENEARFSQVLERVQCGSMRYKAANDLPFGVGWNTDKNYSQGLSSVRWAMTNIPSLRLCRTFEVPFANAGGAVVTPQTARDLGRDLAKALKAFFTEADSTGVPPKAISGVYPTLFTYNREGECGTGAVVPWAGSLWHLSYAPHRPNGSTDKLYEVKPDLTRVIRRESIGGTPANRMIHPESKQLFIGPYAIDEQGAVRVMKPINADGSTNLYGRLTATARHLTDPAHKLYMMTMEEGVYEVDVDTLKVTELFRDGNIQGKAGYGSHAGDLLPGYHGKGGYSGQGRLVYANNGEYSKAAMKDPTIESGVLAQWNGKPGKENWEVVLRNQFTDVTSKGGITGAADPEKDPLWAVGWDDKSVILMILENGAWHKYRLPKGSHSYDGAHGWNTEWPRIREIGEGDDYLMTMHGTFWHFPSTMSVTNSAGIRPRSNYLKIVGDFCRWGDKVVLGCDDTAANEFLNKRKAKGKMGAPSQSNSSLWFLDPQDLDSFGPVIGRGAVWKNEDVKAGTVSDPYLYDGYDHHTLAVKMEGEGSLALEVDREGNGVWEEVGSFVYNAEKPMIWLDTDKPTAWMRLRAKTDLTNVTAFFNYANTDKRRTGKAEKTATKAILRSGKGDERLPLEVAQGDDYYEMRPAADGTLALVKTDNDKQLADLKKWMAIRPDEDLGDGYDAASAYIVDDDGKRWRFPYANEKLRWNYAREGRLCRECCTERDLLNLAGILYELPAENAGGFAKIRAITTTGASAYDYATWRGLFVIAGLDPKAGVGTTVTSDDGKVSLWVGVADDLWKFGRATGIGGPWAQTEVKAGVPSDPYLATGFEKKLVGVVADRDATITIEADITGTGVWVKAAVCDLKAGKQKTFNLTPGRAYWYRAVADRDCTATVQFIYR